MGNGVEVSWMCLSLCSREVWIHSNCFSSLWDYTQKIPKEVLHNCLSCCSYEEFQAVLSSFPSINGKVSPNTEKSNTFKSCCFIFWAFLFLFFHELSIICWVFSSRTLLTFFFMRVIPQIDNKPPITSFGIHFLFGETKIYSSSLATS